jgi:predicted CoA-binding protein
VAVLGAHTSPEKPAFYVPDYLAGQGYRIVPVNPAFAGKREAWGEPFRARLDEIAEPVDIVDVFRRSEAVIDHVDEILAMQPLPRLVWLQSGIRNDDAAARLRAAGIDVVQDRCTLADHRRFGIAPIG